MTQGDDFAVMGSSDRLADLENKIAGCTQPKAKITTQGFTESIKAFSRRMQTKSLPWKDDVARAAARSEVKLPARTYPAMRLGTTAMLNSFWKNAGYSHGLDPEIDIGLDAETARVRIHMDFNDCVDVLLSAGVRTDTIVVSRTEVCKGEVTSVEEGHDVK